MPHSKKVRVLRKPSKAETGLARLCDEPATAKHRPGRAALERSDAKPPIAGLIDYALGGSDVARCQLSLNVHSEAADSWRDAVDAFKAAWDDGLRAAAVELIREHGIERPRNVTPAQVIHVPVPVDSELLKNELHPFYLGNAAQTVLKLLPERRDQWRKFFALYGCLACGQRERLHVACGLCEICYERTAARLRKVRKIPTDRLSAEQAALVDPGYERRPPEPEPLERWKCKTCGFVSKPMPQTKWELSARVLHEQGSRHQRALRRRQRKGE